MIELKPQEEDTSAEALKSCRAMGVRLAKISPTRGFAAELATALIITVAAQYSLPTSSSQCITGLTVMYPLYQQKAVFILLHLLISCPILTLQQLKNKKLIRNFTACAEAIDCRVQLCLLAKMLQQFYAMMTELFKLQHHRSADWVQEPLSVSGSWRALGGSTGSSSHASLLPGFALLPSLGS